MFRNYSRIVLIGLAIVIFAYAMPASADPCCCNCGTVVYVGFDYWYPWDFDQCGCWTENWWIVPYWQWRPSWRRIVRIYYSPDGWYRYEYYPYYCSGCRYTYVEGRWVYRRAVRLHRRYTYRDMGSDFIRRRGTGTTRYRTSSSARSSGSVSTYRTNRSYTTSSGGDNWHRTKTTTTVSAATTVSGATTSRTTSSDRNRERDYSISSSNRSNNSHSTSSGSHHTSSHSSKPGSRNRTK